MSGWFPMFLSLFALGVGAASSTVPFREIGRYYFTFHANIALFAVAIAVILGKPWEGFGAGSPLARFAAVAGMVYALSVLVQNGVARAARKDLRVDALLFPVSVGVPFVALAVFGLPKYGPGEALLLLVHLLTSAAVLGSTFTAMTTGHWYLSNAALSFDILARLCRFAAGAVAAKAVVVAVWAVARFGRYWALEDFDKLVMGVRIGAGLVFGMALSLMSLACAKRRANQSATGILYVAVVFALIGEAISIYLTLGKGRPI